LAILGWTLWYLFTKTLPAHAKALKEEQDAYLQAQRETREEFRRALDRLTEAIKAKGWGGESPGKTGLAWIVDICSIGDRIFVAAWRLWCVEDD
jgi:hypothetical protein